MRNERTSKRVATIAGKLLRVKAKRGTAFYAWCDTELVEVKWSDIRALAASALTQAADKTSRKAARKRAVKRRGRD